MIKRIIFLIFLMGFFLQISNAQSLFNKSIAISTPQASSMEDMYSKTASNGAVVVWQYNLQPDINGYYVFSLKAPVAFTSFGVGWISNNTNIPAGDFYVTYRSKKNEGKWSEWLTTDGFVAPDETPTGLYWTDLLFCETDELHHELEFKVIVPNGIQLNEVRISLIDITNTSDEPSEINDTQGILNCPPLPAIVPRSQWCGNYTACHNTTLFTNITPTHTVIHHGASPNTYTDGAAVVRSYWNYHVNTLGWQDIGYNYLFCKTGSMYQGRHNPNLPNTDVRGAHGGNANNESIGVNFLGNADVTLPTTVQLNKLKSFFAWWYDHKNFDPTSSASLTTQAFGVQIKPRICGHKDIGQTSCPGTVLYNHIPSIRTGTKAIIDSCSGNTNLGPINLIPQISSCPNLTVSLNWSNSGTGWYILLANNANYNNAYIKWVSGQTSTVAPTGFVLQSNNTTPLILVEGQTYHWKIWDGSTFRLGPVFTLPLCDITAPTTSISTPNTWKTQDFIATFSDFDNVGGSGVSKKFYLVSDFNGAYWRANDQKGYYADNFETIDPAIWTIPANSGTWSASNNQLLQTNNSHDNSNIYASLNQNLWNRYLYHFVAKAEGSTHPDGRRFGLHYFCDNAALTNRGNSYLVLFRIETSKLEFYKVTNDVLSLVNVVDDVVINPGIFYDIKIVFDKSTAESLVYVNDVFKGYWKDDNPFPSTNGKHVSFRSARSLLTVNEFNVYCTRQSSVNISLGNDITKDIRYQNFGSTSFAAKIKSIVIDSAHNISNVAVHNLKVDWTIPDNVPYINDGLGTDMDTTTSYTQLSANWGMSSDPHSNIESYWYAIGTSPCDSNIVSWTNNGLSTQFTRTGLSLNFNTTYYISVRARNGAGLVSNISSSDGIVVYNHSSSLAANLSVSHTDICEGTSIFFTNQSLGSNSVKWVFSGGQPAVSFNSNPTVLYTNAGSFDVQLIAFDANNNSDTLFLPNYITVYASSHADFSAMDNIIFLPNATAYFYNNSTSADSYLWSFGDGNVSTDLNPWHTYTTQGYYNVQLIAYSSMCDNDTLTQNNYIFVSGSTQVIMPQNDYYNLEMLTNPVIDKVTFQLNVINNTKLNFEITDALGRVINSIPSQNYDKGQHNIFIPFSQRLASGVYYLHITSDDVPKTYYKLLKL